MVQRLTCPEYEQMKKEYISGWKTWNVENVFSYVHMPDALALNLCLREYQDGHFLREALIGRFPREGEDDSVEVLYPGDHALDDSYTEMEIEWQDIRLKVETAADQDMFALLITPEKTQIRPVQLMLTGGYLWNRRGFVLRERLSGHTGDGLAGNGDTANEKAAEEYAENEEAEITGSIDDCTYLHACAGEEQWDIFASAPVSEEDAGAPLLTPFLAVRMDGPTGFLAVRSSQGKKSPAAGQTPGKASDQDILEQTEALVRKNREALRAKHASYGENSWLYQALECAISWDSVYDPNHDRVISPVSRLWSIRMGGYVLFCWDNCFAAYMAAEGNKALAYSNIIEILNERTEKGFVPNLSYGTGQKSEDRSQPPVGSRMLLELYKRFGDRWIIELLYPALLTWNTWFFENRSASSGALCWGSDPTPVLFGNRWEKDGVNDRYGAALESGLDNSPMYDDIPFDKETHLLMLEDAGLTGLYIMDCNALLELAGILGKTEDAALLKKRREAAEKGLEGLWDEENGFYYNRRTDTGEFSRRISPTNFYALFSDQVSPAREERILKEHYYNPDEFYGEWMLPSIARNDPAYMDQDYWRGRVWAPMNFLVYLAFEQHGLKEACRDLARKSVHIFKPEWDEHRHVHENYNSITGQGCDAHNSDKFYHWGALLSCIALREHDKQK